MSKFYEYFRMTQYVFHILHKKIENNIKKQESHWRKPICKLYCTDDKLNNK